MTDELRRSHERKKKENLIKSRDAVVKSLDRAIQSKDSWKAVIETKTLKRINEKLEKLKTT